MFYRSLKLVLILLIALPLASFGNRKTSDQEIVRKVKVDRSKTPQQQLAAVNGRQEVDPEVLKTLPAGSNNGIEEVEVHLFSLKKDMSPAQLDQEYERLGLVQDHYAQIAVNIEDPDFVEQHTNVAYWDRDGKVVSALIFSQSDQGRSVVCIRGETYWGKGVWFAGVKKEQH